MALCLVYTAPAIIHFVNINSKQQIKADDDDIFTLFFINFLGPRAGFVQVLRDNEEFHGRAEHSERKRRSDIWKFARYL